MKASENLERDNFCKMTENEATTTGGTSNKSTEDTQQQNDEMRNVYNKN